MNANHSAAQHRSQIRKLRRSIVINTPIIVVCFIAVVCSYYFDWFILIKVTLTLISFMQLMHLPGLFTRLSEQKRKLAAIESSMNADSQPVVQAGRR